MSPATFPGVGDVVGGYRIDGVIGRGGMGVVFLAEHRHLARKVALKVVAPELTEDARFRERFLRESRLAGSIDHPNIITIYDAGEADGLLYLAMQYVSGTDLASLLRAERPLGHDRALRIMGAVGEALDAAHASGLVHRDVKPNNILIHAGTPPGADRVQLTDFGLARRTASVSGLTRSGEVLGTALYMAPEQLQGRNVDGRADIYALGCVLYECLTGHRPFEREEPAALFFAHLNAPPPAPSERVPSLPKGLDEVVRIAMAKDPDQRFPTCRALIDSGWASVTPTSPPAAGSTASDLAPTVVIERSASGPSRRTAPPHPAAPGADATVAAGSHPAAPLAATPAPGAPRPLPLSARATGRGRWHAPAALPAIAGVVAVVLLATAGALALSRGLGAPGATPASPTGRPPVVSEGRGFVSFDVAASACASSRDCFIFLLDAVSDPEGDPVTLDSVGPSTEGNTVTVETFDGREVARWVAAPSFTGTNDSFSFTVSDDHGNVVDATCRVENVPPRPQ